MEIATLYLIPIVVVALIVVHLWKRRKKRLQEMNHNVVYLFEYKRRRK